MAFLTLPAGSVLAESEESGSGTSGSGESSGSSEPAETTEVHDAEDTPGETTEAHDPEDTAAATTEVHDPEDDADSSGEGSAGGSEGTEGADSGDDNETDSSGPSDDGDADEDDSEDNETDEDDQDELEEREQASQRNFQGSFQLTGDRVQGRFVGFEFTTSGLRAYQVGDRVVFAEVVLSGRTLDFDIEAEGAVLKAEAEESHLKAIDNPTGHLRLESEDGIVLVLAQNYTAEPSNDSSEHGSERLRILGPDGFAAWVNGDGLSVNGSRIESPKEARFAVQVSGLRGHLSHHIDDAVDNGTIVGEVNVAKEDDDAVPIEHGDVNMTTLRSEDGILITIEGQGPGKVVLFNLQRDALGRVEDLVIRFDNQTIEPADDLQDILDVQAEEPAEYLIVVGRNATQVLVAVPHFSVHTIELQGMTTQSAATVVASAAGSMAAFLMAGVLTVAAAAAAVGLRARGK